MPLYISLHLFSISEIANSWWNLDWRKWTSYLIDTEALVTPQKLGESKAVQNGRLKKNKKNSSWGCGDAFSKLRNLKNVTLYIDLNWVWLILLIQTRVQCRPLLVRECCIKEDITETGSSARVTTVLILFCFNCTWV